MFDFIRSHTRLALGLLLLLIIPSFVFFGIENYISLNDGAGADVAKVDGRGITRGEWDQAHQRNIERIRRQMPNVDVKLLDTPQMRRETLDGLVRDRVLLAAANKLNLQPAEDRMVRIFQTDPQFAGLRNPDGSVNRDLLAAQGMSSEMFAAQLRQEFGMQQVLGGLGASVFAAKTPTAAALDALLQRREVQLQRFDSAAYRDKVQPTDAQLEAYYKANEAQFRTPEQAAIEYVVLDLDTLMKGVVVPENELRDAYTANIARYTLPEERRASHILIKADKDMSADDRAKAKARAEQLLAEVRKNPAGFAEIARKNSQDPGSAAQGGDLDFFGRGAMVKPFEDVTFTMKPGEISNVVESDFGYHIIQLVQVRGGDKKPFDAVRAEIEGEARKAAAQKKYAEAAEQFTNTVYEQSDSLQPVVDKLKLEKRTAVVTRAPAPAASGALASSKLLDAVFADDAVRNKRNTDAVEVAPNQMASARIVTYTPARALPLTEVKERVRASVVAAEAATQARKDGEARLAALQKAPAESLPSTVIVSRAQMQDQPREVVDAVLKADAAVLPKTLGIDLGAAGYVVAKVTQVLPRDPVPGGDAPVQAQYAQAWAQAEAQAYLGALKKRFKVELKEVAVAEAAASSATP